MAAAKAKPVSTACPPHPLPQAHVDRLEAQRRLLVSARSVSLAQRMLLYAHDELAMATMRLRLAVEGGCRVRVSCVCVKGG